MGAPMEQPLPHERKGFWARRRERKRLRQVAAARLAYTQAMQTWEQETAELRDMIDTAHTFKGATAADGVEIPIALKRGERVFGVYQGAALVETRRGQGHYVGGYSGFSFRIAKGVRFHTGGTRGTYTAGDERPTPIDTGVVTLTNQRVVFEGTKQAREWAFSKLIGFQHDPVLPWTSIAVSNRQKVSGFLYDKEHAADVHFRIALALAHYNTTVDHLVADLDRQLAEHERARPQLHAGPS